jgi:PAS domain S-box-containing protein
MLPDVLRFSWHALPYFPAAALMAATGVWLCLRERRSRVSLEFLAFTSLFALWMVLLGLRLLMIDDHAATVISRYVYAAVLLGLMPLLQFSLMVLDTRRARRGFIRLSCAVGIALALCAVGTPWAVAGVVQMPWGFEPRQGALGPLFTLWVGGLLAAVAYDFLRARRHGRSSAYHRRQVRTFGISLALLFVAMTDVVTDTLGMPAYPVAPACILAFTLMTAAITIRHGVANVTVRFATPEFADVMRAGFMVLDRDGVIQFVNEPSARMFCMGRHQLLGQTLGEVLGAPAAPEELAAMARSPTDGVCEIVYAAPGCPTPRHLALSVSGLNDPRGQLIALVCLLRDVTEEHQERERHAAAQVPQPTREELELRQALARREFVVHYQPIVELRRGTTAGYEALVRWRHPRLGLRQPQDFLPAAETLGLIGAIDHFVLEQACRDMPVLRTATGNPALFVSVNQSTASLSSPDLVAALGGLVASRGLAPRNIRLELLESTVVNDAVRDTLRRLRDAGFGICIDDFGTGHSALSRLHEAPVTALKIDRLFVNEMLHGNGRKIIGSIVALATSLDLAVVAEGVTAPEQVELLREMGCGYAQGYLYSMPTVLEGALAALSQGQAEIEQRATGRRA